jgi:hypothetical protein
LRGRDGRSSIFSRDRPSISPSVAAADRKNRLSKIFRLSAQEITGMRRTLFSKDFFVWLRMTFFQHFAPAAAI